MCMQNVNVVTKLYKKTYNPDEQYYYDEVFDTIVAKTIDGNKYIEDFIISIAFNLLGTNNEDKKEDNIVETKGKLFVEVKMCKLSKLPEHQVSTTLTTFEIDLSSEDIVSQKACVPYVMFDKILNVKRIKLPDTGELGNYVIKVRVKAKEDADKWNLQSIYPLRIE